MSGEIVTRENLDEMMDTHTPRFPLSFSFNCYGVEFLADGVESDAGPTLKISGNLGALPYSAESPENRKAIGKMLSMAPEYLNLRMKLSNKKQIIVEGELPLGGSISPSRIVATASAFVASAKPLIEVIKLVAPTFEPKIQIV